MWHLKTKFGVFWVVPVQETKEYLLGVNDQELSFFQDVEEAAKAVHEQSTGFLKWDMQSEQNVPKHIQDWKMGEPQRWESKSTG